MPVTFTYPFVSMISSLPGLLPPFLLENHFGTDCPRWGEGCVRDKKVLIRRGKETHLPPSLLCLWSS